MLDILDSVLEVAKIEAGSTDVDMCPVDVGAEVQEAARLFRSRAQEKGVALKTEIETSGEEIADAGAEADAEDRAGSGVLTTHLDSSMLRGVLDNLIGNALKFIAPGDTITVRAYADWGSSGPEAVQIDVADTGVGIEDAFLPDLFEAFARSPEQKESRHGSGLGLAITKRLTERMGGTIDVESEKRRRNDAHRSVPAIRWSMREGRQRDAVGSTDFPVLRGRFFVLQYRTNGSAWVTSARWPVVKMKRKRFLKASTSVSAFVVKPPREQPSASAVALVFCRQHTDRHVLWPNPPSPTRSGSIQAL